MIIRSEWLRALYEGSVLPRWYVGQPAEAALVDPRFELTLGGTGAEVEFLEASLGGLALRAEALRARLALDLAEFVIM